jgi:16S rRNA G966 N2-methylase RsmD
VVFHDPPFEENSEGDLQLLLQLVRGGGWLFHERGDDLVFSPGGLVPADRRRYGTTRFLIFRPGTR